MDDDNLLGEETSKETRIININELEPTGDWYDDAITDDDDALLYEYSDEEGPRHPIFREGQDLSKFKLVVGMRFRDYKQCRDVLTDVSIREGFELTFLKNEKSRITAKCKENCGWRFHASAVMGGPTIQIKTLKGKHTCPRVRKNWRANYKYLAGVIERAVRENPGMKADQISQYVSRECGVDVTKWTVYRAKKHAMQKIRGVDSVQYAILRDYCETILKFNPRSKIIIRNREGSDPPIFGKLYYSLFGLKMNFLSVCNPIIGLDGCFLKTAFGEQLLAAIGRDGNDGMVPIAIAVVETENYETWTWFLTELLEDIGGIGEDRWTFVSDRQKGLLEALKDLVPNCEHRFCARHMLQNFKKKFKNPDLVRLFWKAAGTGNKNVFDVVMKEIAALDPKLNPNHETVAEWLEKIPPKHWAKSHFLTQCKSECFVNNICESFNNLILVDRE
ncbi:uncharacterized protein [Henckelia pumila]|uniref:uncharacterized protein isoform X1 n=2 Tax=Henckelia pumila TaxID=405737 RepID=UPI003C6EA39C